MKYINKIILILTIIFFSSSVSSAHCDGVDGPVVQAAIKSLETEDISHVMIWIKKENENKIRSAFDKVLKVRKLSPEAMEVADHHFLETVVRIHREGEGEPFTGIKAAGRDLGPVIPAADKSVQSGSLDELSNLITAEILKGLKEKFSTLQSKKDFNIKDTDAGREYVESYVEYLHYAENIYKTAGFKLHEGHKSETSKDEHQH